jgi:hypothetical protein
VETKIDMLLDKCNKAIYTSEDLLQDTKDHLFAREQQIDDLTQKIEIIAKAVKKLAVKQGRLPNKSKES